MTKFLVIAAVLSGLGGAVLWQRAALVSAQAEAAQLTRDLATERAYRASAEEAARVHAAHIKRLEAQEAEWSALTRDLQSMEGRDAPLSDHLRAAAGRLWP